MCLQVTTIGKNGSYTIFCEDLVPLSTFCVTMENFGRARAAPQAKIAADFSASCSGAAAVSDGADFPVMEGFTECATHTATATLGSRIRSEWNERSRA